MWINVETLLSHGINSHRKNLHRKTSHSGKNKILKCTWTPKSLQKWTQFWFRRYKNCGDFFFENTARTFSNIRREISNIHFTCHCHEILSHFNEHMNIRFFYKLCGEILSRDKQFKGQSLRGDLLTSAAKINRHREFSSFSVVIFHNGPK